MKLQMNTDERGPTSACVCLLINFGNPKVEMKRVIVD
jgi:hypothetical protein